MSGLDRLKIHYAPIVAGMSPYGHSRFLRTGLVLVCVALLYCAFLRPMLQAAGCDFWETAVPQDVQNPLFQQLYRMFPGLFIFNPDWGIINPENFSPARQALYKDYCNKYASEATVDMRNRTVSWRSLEAISPNKMVAGVPLILHQMHHSRAALPAYLEEYVTGCRNMSKRWVHVLWEDSDFEPFLKTKYPNFWPTFEALETPILKIDAVRYAIMHAYGGVYLDADVHCLRPLNDWLRHYIHPAAPNFSVLIEPIHIMGSPARHNFWQRIMDLLIKDSRWSVAGRGLLEPAARPFVNTRNAVLIDRTRLRSKRLFTKSRHFEMLGVSTWHWKHMRDRCLSICDACTVIISVLGVALLAWEARARALPRHL